MMTKTVAEMIQALEEGAREFERELQLVVNRMVDRERGDTKRFCQVRDDLAARGLYYDPPGACIDLGDEDEDWPGYPYPN